MSLYQRKQTHIVDKRQLMKEAIPYFLPELNFYQQKFGVQFHKYSLWSQGSVSVVLRKYKLIIQQVVYICSIHKPELN